MNDTPRIRVLCPAAALTWANPSLTRLEDQALVPMYGDHPEQKQDLVAFLQSLPTTSCCATDSLRIPYATLTRPMLPRGCT